MSHPGISRYVAGWRLSIKDMTLSGNRHWYVIVGEKEGKRYMFSRHMTYDWAELRLNSIDYPDECQHTPLFE